MRYRILVRGAVSDRFSLVFENMGVRREGATTEIAGDVTDPAQLYAMLDLLSERGTEILSLTQARREDDTELTRSRRPSSPVGRSS
jgi:hypothetical protein